MTAELFRHASDLGVEALTGMVAKGKCIQLNDGALDRLARDFTFLALKEIAGSDDIQIPEEMVAYVRSSLLEKAPIILDA